jgi:hypothetical protein
LMSVECSLEPFGASERSSEWKVRQLPGRVYSDDRT